METNYNKEQYDLRLANAEYRWSVESAEKKVRAAAPDLLAACEEAEWLLQKLVDMDRLPANIKALRDVRAAIAKAKGEA